MATTADAPPKKRAQVPLISKLSFSLGEFGSQFVWTTVGSYLVLFYTDVALIAPAAAATIMLVARVLDGIQDIGFGYIAERTKSRWGRFRPYVMFGAPFLSLSLVIAFVSPNSGDTVKVWYAGVTYVILCFVYTVVNMAYGAMAGVMTTDTDERLTLNWVRSIGSGLSQVFLSVVTMPMILFFSGIGDGKTYNSRGFLMTIIVFAIVSLPMFIIAGAKSKEVITMAPEQSNVPLRTTIKAVFGNLPLMCVFGMLLINLIGLFGRIGLVAFYVINNMGEPTKVAAVFTAFTIFTTLGQFAMPKLATVVGKARMCILSLLLSAVALIAIFFADPHNFTLILALTAVYGFSGFAAPIALSMIPDAVDHYEWKHGIRADGTSYATVSLSTKIASAFGGAIGLYIIGWFGYNGAAKVQTAEAIQGINIAANLVPAVLALVAVIPMLFYKLDHKTMQKVAKDLEERRAAGTIVADAEDED
ncbi:MFS transporter [Nanchangia anserum]|uniref:MFS transporter n=1 Tax=Nanchangia anserum TaxID=2692125 RepID=A0A8I0G8C6_9ACTO|nr:glycoside-pentoside-hexuronide (GPH):cation symporter [Nanchangia anserum]MBD3689732.1 MFS transporter [Nanchangia anserum]QOX81904.1 MFS transporter [Nanchangia anserum]